MKIAVSATGASLDADAEPRFGRCPYFIIADSETMEFEAVDNAAAMEGGGAGISAAQAIADKGVQAVLTGNCGPNAYQVLSAAGIQIITGISGSVKDAIESYRSGRFKAGDRANVPDHFGLGGGPGGGRGSGIGKGCGRGKGRGMRSEMTSSSGVSQQHQSAGEELQELKIQSKAMMQQLADIQRRIQELENK